MLEAKLNHKVAVLIPCLNEAKSILKTISEVRSVLPLSMIFVIDNGSTDSTPDLAAKAGAKVLFEPQRGKGFAVRKGFDNIPFDTDAIFMVDGDGTYGVESLHEAIDKVVSQGFDMVIGVRRVTQGVGSNNAREFRVGHELGNRILTFTFNRLFGVPISDSLSGWRVLSPGFVNSFPGGASEFEIEAELNSHVHTLKCAISEVNVEYKSRVEGSESKLRTYRDGIKILKKNLLLYRSEKPSRAFTLMSLPWLLAGTLLSSRVLGDYLQTQLVPKFPSLIASIGAFIIGSNLWVTGMILERVRLQRVASARIAYRESTRMLRSWPPTS
jgi:glycosyltransferase involved in cell wall biosynthesis